MGAVESRYAEIKQKMRDARKALIKDIVYLRNKYMLDAMRTCANLSKYFLNTFDMTKSVVDILGKKHFLAYPDFVTPTLGSVTVEPVRVKWIGTTRDVQVDNTIEKIIPIPEFVIYPYNIKDFTKLLNTALAHNLFLKYPYKEENKELYDMFDLNYGYITAKYIDQIAPINSCFITENKVTLGRYVDWFLDPAVSEYLDYEIIVIYATVFSVTFDRPPLVSNYTIYFMTDVTAVVWIVTTEHIFNVQTPYGVCIFRPLTDAILVLPNKLELVLTNAVKGVYLPIPSHTGNMCMIRVAENITYPYP